MAALQAFLAHKRYEIGKPLNDPSLHSEVEHFANWVLDIRNGNIEGIETSDGSDTICIPITQDLLIEQSLGLDGLINAIYPQIHTNFEDISFLQERAILAPTNEQVSAINDRILSFLPGDFVHI